MPLLNKNIVLDSASLLRSLTTSKHQRQLVDDFGARRLAAADKTVCVWQAELAVVEEAVIIASTSATTCCIVAIVSTEANWAIIAHLDDRMDSQLPILEALMRDRQPGPVQLFLVGCHGPEGVVKAKQLLTFLHETPHLQLHVALAAIGRLNCNRATGNILHRDLAVNTATAVAMPGCYGGRGPLLPLRMARSWTSLATRPLEPIFHTASGQLRIAPVSVDWEVVTRGYVQALKESRDDEILEETSTSPNQEAPNFVSDVRIVLDWLLKHPETAAIPTQTVEGVPYDFAFEWKDSSWTACKQ